MRIWQDAHDNLITDEQLVRHIAAYGSLSSALEAGDIRLVASTASDGEPMKDSQNVGRRRAHAPLSSFL